MTIEKQVKKQAQLAFKASQRMARASTLEKNQALLLIAEQLENSVEKIIMENNKDLLAAEKAGLSAAFIDRLRLTEKRIKDMVSGLKELVKLDDPVGNIVKMWKRPNGLQIGQMQVPLGVIGIIYESRPNVTIDTIGLALKSGNAIILRGGSEAIHSNKILAELASKALAASSLPEEAVQLISTKDRKAVEVLFNLTAYLDVLIPRGGAQLINKVLNESKVPVIETGVGNCHIYVDAAADLEMALKIVDNAKTSRPAVCNAAESLLVHQKVAQDFLPRLYDLFSKKGVELRGCPRSREIIPAIKAAEAEDWGKEYLDYIMSVKVVADYEEAVAHINRYGTGHSEAIITNDYQKSQRFLQEINAAAVYINASTRFTDGNQFGLGAELGISTQKLHARGPLGLNELTTTKYIIFGQGQVRE